MPLRITGDVSNGSSTFRYVAAWDDSLSGFYFAPPGRPSLWTSTTLTVDAAGVVKIGSDVVGDWSQGAIGRPIVSGSFVFSPIETDYGVSWYLPRFIDWFGWGMVAGFAWDLSNIMFNFILGAFVKDTTDVFS